MIYVPWRSVVTITQSELNFNLSIEISVSKSSFYTSFDHALFTLINLSLLRNFNFSFSITSFIQA
jgi:hypothetical protein